MSFKYRTKEQLRTDHSDTVYTEDTVDHVYGLKRKRFIRSGSTSSVKSNRSKDSKTSLK